MKDRRLKVEVEGPSGGFRTLALPLDARIDDLLPALVELCVGRSESAGWRLAPRGEGALAGEQRLADCGLFPGAVLVLIEPPAREGAEEGSTWAERIPAAAQQVRAGLRTRPQPQRIDRMGDADYQRLLESAIATPGVGASAVITVISLHPGLGATTITALLATLLGRLRSDRLVAVDASPESGALSHWLVPDRGLSADAYRALFAPSVTPEEVRSAMVGLSSGLSMVPGPAADVAGPGIDAPAWSRLIEHLRHLNNMVLVDGGAGFQRPAVQAALAAADHVVVVSKPEPPEVGRLRPTLDRLRKQARSVVVVANRAPRRARSARSAAGFQLVTVAYEPEAAARLKMRGFSWAEAPPSWQESVRELAAALVGSMVEMRG